MQELLKNVLYTGVGLASVTREKVQEFVDKMIEEGKSSRVEGEKVVDDLVDDAEEKRDELEDQVKGFEGQVRKIVEDVFNRLKVVSKRDYDTLLKRIEGLEGVEVAPEAASKVAPKRKTAPKKKVAATVAE